MTSPETQGRVTRGEVGVIEVIEMMDPGTWYGCAGTGEKRVLKEIQDNERERLGLQTRLAHWQATKAKAAAALLGELGTAP